MNFALAMLVLLVVTGSVWLLDRLYLSRRRDAAVRAALERASPQLESRAGETAADQQARKEDPASGPWKPRNFHR